MQVQDRGRNPHSMLWRSSRWEITSVVTSPAAQGRADQGYDRRGEQVIWGVHTSEYGVLGEVAFNDDQFATGSA
jgi:hypothetical protein